MTGNLCLKLKGLALQLLCLHPDYPRLCGNLADQFFIAQDFYLHFYRTCYTVKLCQIHISAEI